MGGIFGIFKTRKEKAIMENTEKGSAATEAETEIKGLDEIREAYPDADIDAELENARFLALLRGEPLDAKTAYELLHPELQAKEGEQPPQRPSENGRMGGSTASVKTDPSRFTKKDLAEIRRQVAQGRTVRFD